MSRAVAAALLLCACTGAPSTPAPGETSIGPGLWDCTSLGPDGTRLPARATPVPASCVTDPTCRTPLVAGHRGAGGAFGDLAPENTLAAYRAAIALGIEFGETDPRPTADGVLVNVHDSTVDRTTEGAGAVSELTLAQVRALRVKSGAIAGDYSCERIPTLVEVLRTCRGRLVVLVDANKTDRVDLLVQAIQEADALDWAVFDTSSVEKVDAALALEPRLLFQLRPQRTEDVVPQLDHFAPRLPTLVELNGDDWAAAAALVHARGTRAFTNVFLGDVVAVYDGDYQGYFDALDAGIDVLQTDRPALVLDALRQRGLR